MRAGIGRAGDRSPLGGGVQRRELRHALSRIARAPDGRRLVARAGSDPTLASLLAAAAGLVRHHARHVESRQLASLLHACGKLGVGNLDAANALVSAVERATEAHASKFNPQELANALWGCAKLGVRLDSALVRLLGDAAAASLKRGGSEKKKKAFDWRADWTAQGVSNAVWAFATLGASARDPLGHETFLFSLFSAIETKARGGAFNAQETRAPPVARLAAGADVFDRGGGERRREDRTFSKRFGSEALCSARAAASALAASTTARGSSGRARRQPRSQHVANIAACGKLGLASDARVAEAVGRRRRRARRQRAGAYDRLGHGRPCSRITAPTEKAPIREWKRKRTATCVPPASSPRAAGRPAAAAGDDGARRQARRVRLGLDGRHRRGCPGAAGAAGGPRVAPGRREPALGVRAGLGEEVRAPGRRRSARARAPRRGKTRARLRGRDVFGGAKPTQQSFSTSSSRERHVLVAAVDHGVWSQRSRHAKTLDALVSAVRWARRAERARLVRRRLPRRAGVTSAQKPKLVAHGPRARRCLEFNAQEPRSWARSSGLAGPTLSSPRRRRRNGARATTSRRWRAFSAETAEASPLPSAGLPVNRRRVPSARLRSRRPPRAASRAPRRSSRAWTTAAAGGAGGTRAWRCGRGRLCSRSGFRAKPIRVSRRT